MNSESENFGSIAIIGLSGRFPGANTIAQFWQNLVNGIEGISFLSDEELAASGIELAVYQQTNYVKAYPALADIDQFDADFFQITPKEASQMDPQKRIFMEIVWEALENAGYTPESVDLIGVYAGCGTSGYWPFRPDATQPMLSLENELATDKDYLATYVSYKLNLTGPSMTVQTACSTSLVATSLACQGLLTYQCDLALAGGVTIRVPQAGYLYVPGGLESADGHCRTFDAQAQGTVFGNGAGVVALKRLEDALADGDQIYAVIKGSAINNDGWGKIGYTAPSREGQVQVIEMAHNIAEISAETISYIEAHGTGTPLGDPIEISALTQAFQASTDQTGFCAIGSVKANVGHLDTASGVTGLIKTALALKHKQIPPSINFEQPNPKIDFANSPFYVNTTLTDWYTNGFPCRAGVSSFGIGGTNVHLVLEEAPQDLELMTDESRIKKSTQHILTLSGKTEAALAAQITQYLDYLKQHPTLNLADVCYTANTGRVHFEHRLAVIAKDVAELQNKLAASQQGEMVNDLVQGKVKADATKIAFLFTGQGSQYVDMGRELYDTEPLFREIMGQCDQILQGYWDKSLLEILYGENQETNNNLLSQTKYTQPALFALEYALAKLWQSWRIEPIAVIGHSVGEYVAACVAGVFSLEEGLKLIAARGRLMQALPQNGTMVAVQVDEVKLSQTIEPYPNRVSIAGFNAPQSLVLSGDTEAVNQVVEQLQREGIKCKPLIVSHAFHSPLMEPMLAEFGEIAQTIDYAKPQLKLVSNLSGKLLTDIKADYWTRHVRQPVRFAQGMTTLAEVGIDTFIEIGPKPTLLGLSKQCLNDPIERLWLPSLYPNQRSDWAQMLESLAKLYIQGGQIDWVAFDKPNSRQKLSLPTYPFQRQRYWIEPSKENLLHVLGPLLDKMIKSPLHKATLFETKVSTRRLPFLVDHQVYDKVVSPGACHLAMIFSAAEVMFGTPNCVLENVIFPQALVVPKEENRTVQVVFTRTTEHTEFQLISIDEEDNILTHTSGRIITPGTSKTKVMSLPKLRDNCPTEIASETLYQIYTEQQINFGPTFRWLSHIWVGKDEAIVKLERPLAVSSLQGYLLHPGLLDSCFQTTTALLLEQNEQQPRVSFAIAKMRLNASVQGDAWWCYTRQVEKNKKWDIFLLAKDGQVLAEMFGFEDRAAPREAFQLAPVWQDWFYTVNWQPRPQFGLLPDYLPKPQQFFETLTAQFTTQTSQLDWSHLIQEEEQLEALSQAIVLFALTKLGFVWQPGLRLRREQIMAQLSIIPSYERLLSRLLEMLTEPLTEYDTNPVDKAVLQRDDTEWVVVGKPSRTELPFVEHKPTTPALTLLSRCGDKLAEVLRGAQEPLELLFPGGDASTVTALFQDSLTAKVMNELVQQAVQTALEQLPTEEGIRILEVGAGTGGTTKYILPHLPASRTKYVFTDIGQTFISQAQEKFHEYDFVQYQVLDIEQEPTTQGFLPLQYDLIIAANVLHATQDLSQTLAHTQQLLKPGGVLLLLEDTSCRRWVDLTFGLTEGWWRFSDVDRRPNHPLLTTKQWRALLSECGFQAVTCVPEDASAEEPLGETVILAQAGPATQGRQWLLLADTAGIAEALADKLRTWGECPLLVWAGDKYEQLNEHTFKINPVMIADYQRLLQTIPDVSGIVHLWSLDSPPPETTADLEVASQKSCGTALHLVQTMLNKPMPLSPALWLVTQGAQAVLQEDTLKGVVQAPLWGMGRTIALEHPELNCACLDLDTQTSIQTQSEKLCAEIMATSPRKDKEQVALRQNQRYVARLVRHQIAPSEPFHLEITERGTLNNMRLRPIARRTPESGEVEIRIRATGLNFRDVLKVLDLYPGEGPLREECTGDIVAVGEGVLEFAIGDPVIVIAPDCFSQYLTVNTKRVFHKPENLTYEEAAGIPSAFLTAIYSLQYVTQIKPNDRVLIHAAAGGVGMAAIQIVQQAGAEVFGTASPTKWETLKSLGIKHIYNSRTLDFADQVMADTKGQGVDIVLNSLTGKGFIEKSLSVLAPNGRFVEMAKRDILSSSEVRALRPDVSYHIVDLSQDQSQDSRLFKELLPQFQAGTLKPLPYTEFAIDDVANAFRYMQQAKHIGKIIVTQKQPVTIHDNGTYLITGGLGGLGLKIANWLVEQGARHLMLMGRSQPKAKIQAQLESLKKLGAEITLVQADVSDTKQMAQALQEINTHYPLRGIIHSVGVLDDGAILRLSWERFMKVLAPKMWGAWNLHQLTRQMPLDFFILFSSSTGLFGNPGQANHAAANTFLDAFAHYRVHQNLPALTIIWGFWSEIGATAEMMRSGRFIPQPGEAPIAPEQGLEILAHLLQHPSREPLIAAKPIDWKPFLAGNVKLNTPFFETFALPATTPTPTTNQSALQQQLSQASADERYEILENLIKSEIELIVGRAPTDEQDFSDMGIDSLMSIQLANRLSAALQTSLPATITLEYATVKKLTRYLAELLAVEEKPQITLEMGLLANDKIDSSIKPKLEPADNQAEPTRLIQATLIPLQPHGEQQPFFCIPSLGSHATNLYKLAQTLGEKRPVYGFQAVGLDGQNTPHQTVEEMANFYMQCLKTIQPQGPYLLGGHSLGGKIAFEIARQLHQQGDKINQVIMIDSAAPPYLYNTVANETELFLSISHFYRFASGKNLIISSSKLQKLDRHQKIHYLHEQFQQAGLIAPNGDVSQIIGIVQVFEAMLNFNYNPPPEKYPWPITLIQANDLLDDEIQLGEDRSEPSWGWQKFTLESVDVHHVPGNHFTMLQSPHVERLGDLLRDCLQS